MAESAIDWSRVAVAGEHTATRFGHVNALIDAKIHAGGVDNRSCCRRPADRQASAFA